MLALLNNSPSVLKISFKDSLFQNSAPQRKKDPWSYWDKHLETVLDSEWVSTFSQTTASVMRQNASSKKITWPNTYTQNTCQLLYGCFEKFPQCFESSKILVNHRTKWVDMRLVSSLSKALRIIIKSTSSTTISDNNKKPSLPHIITLFLAVATTSLGYWTKAWFQSNSIPKIFKIFLST